MDIKNPIAEPVAPPAHETVRIKVTIGGDKYLACGFLEVDEKSIGGQTMLDRTGHIEGTRSINDDDWVKLYRSRGSFSHEFQGTGFKRLATARREPAPHWQYVSCFELEHGKWCDCGISVNGLWGEDVLVLRRCIK